MTKETNDYGNVKLLEAKKVPPKDALNWLNITAYALGHFINDLTAYTIITYYLFYWSIVREMPAHDIGFILFTGQVFDAAITPVFGAISDNIESPIGNRKTVYIAGLLMNMIGGLVMFDSLGGCWICYEGDQNYSATWTLFQTVAFCVYNAGFAAIQVAHLAVVPTSSACFDQKNLLVSLRTAMTFVAGSLSMLVASVNLLMIEDIGQALRFNIEINYIIVGVCSLCFVLFFNEKHLTEVVNEYYKFVQMNPELFEEDEKSSLRSSFKETREVGEPKEIEMSGLNNNEIERQESISDLAKERKGTTQYSERKISVVSSFSYNVNKMNSFDYDSRKENNNQDEKKVRPTGWLKQPKFWQYVVVYTSARMCQNFTPIVIPIFLKNVVETEEKLHLTMVPLVFLLASCVGSLGMKKIASNYSRYAINNGVVLVIVLSLLVLTFDGLVGGNNWFVMLSVYVMYSIIGAAYAIYLTNSTGYISDLIGEHGNSGAFVYGIYSLFDKGFNGTGMFLFNGFDMLDNKVFVVSMNLMIPVATGILGVMAISIPSRKVKFDESDYTYE